MRFRALDGNWDWEFGKGDGSYSRDSLAVAYDLKSKILSWYGDCFFDAGAGIDWKNILGSKNQKERLDSAIRKIITSSSEVEDVVFFDSEITNRVYSFTARIKTIYNETIEVKI